MRQRSHSSGFTLVELLVVIGIIAVLISILLPTLARARAAANTVKCAANLRAIGQGIAIYVANNRGTLPNAYIYDGMTIINGTQLPAAATSGYVHWSYHLYGSAGGTRAIAPEAFACPELDNRGLPATNPRQTELDGGQVAETPGIVDKQVPRISYTLNEAVCGRNKFVVGFQGAIRVYQFIKAGSVRDSGNTIMATEFINDWRIVSDASRTGGGAAVSKSHRPVHGFVFTAGGTPNMEKLAANATYRRATYADLTVDCPTNYDPSSTKTRLDWVGRNHGPKKYDLKKTNFLYCDGHVEGKPIKETLEPFQWGQSFYTLNPSAGLQ
jgi:prepilin-type N-terminal cleavage/methylation domain-containing protein/prepilin-type processing-associated H-X9-DG protein